MSDEEKKKGPPRELAEDEVWIDPSTPRNEIRAAVKKKMPNKAFSYDLTTGIAKILIK